MNVIPLVWTDRHDFEYFPLDEDHPCRTDEPYGLSKVYARPLPHPRIPTLIAFPTQDLRAASRHARAEIPVDAHREPPAELVPRAAVRRAP